MSRKSPPGRRDDRGTQAHGERDALDELEALERLDDELDEREAPSRCAVHDDEVRRLVDMLRRELDRCRACRPPRRPELTLETLAELLVLLTALGPRVGATPPAPSRIDEYIEDMIDPEFGLRPARKVIGEAAELILRGQPALERPRGRSRRGRLLDTDEG